ncbi:hypothetical protein [Spiroplasma poulsonii]|uniref:hypothetical protein n=1 Tax=Spiroplasma poulsonii TaxID=2138 RepID=UPI001F4C55F9|nr:hypothetical protein [Spiroplasma poulsonii]UNF61842.1 hypothetical protein MNU24_07990 [Spiroplasma poulsonii]
MIILMIKLIFIGYFPKLNPTPKTKWTYSGKRKTRSKHRADGTLFWQVFRSEENSNYAFI